MKPLSPSRKTAILPEPLQQNLNAYAIAAGAAGVSLLALAQPAEGKIVYTPVHESAIGVNVDLNNDGIPDFRICVSTNTYHCSHTGPSHKPVSLDALVVKPLKASNGVVGNGSYASALMAGEFVSSKAVFAGGLMASRWCSGSCHHRGQWFNAYRRYLGFKFVIKGKIHYGWARLNVHWLTQKAILSGYAYETIAGKSIVTGKTKGPDDWDTEDFSPDASLNNSIPETPQPASLGMLAFGAQGFPLWRRRKKLPLSDKLIA